LLRLAGGSRPVAVLHDRRKGSGSLGREGAEAMPPKAITAGAVAGDIAAIPV